MYAVGVGHVLVVDAPIVVPCICLSDAVSHGPPESPSLLHPPETSVISTMEYVPNHELTLSALTTPQCGPPEVYP